MQKYWMDVQYSVVQLLARCVSFANTRFNLVLVQAQTDMLASKPANPHQKVK
jgi:hypothetical protein